MGKHKTKNPRIAFVPSDHVLALVTKLSQVSGQPKASIVSELMDDIAPVLSQQIEVFSAMLSKPEKAREHLVALAAQATAQIDQVVMEFKTPRKPRVRRAG